MIYKWPYIPNHIPLYLDYLKSLHIYFFQTYDPCFRKTVRITYCPDLTEIGETTPGKAIKPRDFCRSFQRQNISLSKCVCKFFVVSMKVRAGRPLFGGLADKSGSPPYIPTKCTRWTVLWLPLPPKVLPTFPVCIKCPLFKEALSCLASCLIAAFS